MINQYRYKVELHYDYNNNEIIIDQTNIETIVIDYDYDNKNMPIILIVAKLDRNIIDDMIENCRSKKIILSISKFINNVDTSLDEKYINNRFNFYVSSELNKTKDLDYSDSEGRSDIYRKVTIGLLDADLINNNKKIINEVVNDAFLVNILAYHLNHMKLLIEPPNQTKINNLTVPIITSISKFIKYLDNIYPIYDTQYRLFYDFNKTYLLSSEGNNVPSKDEILNSVLFKINNTLQEESAIQGMEIDMNNGYYSIDVGINDIECYENRSADASYNKIISVDSEGDMLESVLSDESDERIKIEKITTGSLNKSSSIISNIESNTFIATINKIDLDSSIFTINKSYILRFDNELKEKSGKYLLSRKREVYKSDNTNFIASTLLTFRKLKS